MCIHSFNSIYYPILVQGIVAAGGVFVGTNPSYTAFELRHALKVSEAKFVVAEVEILEAVRGAAGEVGILRERVLVFGEEDEAQRCGHKSWRTLLECGEEDWVRFDDLETARNTPAFLMFSSGTTGTSQPPQPRTPYHPPNTHTPYSPPISPTLQAS